MSENELITITDEDITKANQLSHSCPICASAVENNVENEALMPVICANCQTLYHRTCWEQNGNKCATLGCEHNECYPFGAELGPRLTISYADLPKHAPKRVQSPNGRSEKLKAQERRKQRERESQDFWRGLFNRILQAFGRR